MIPDKIPQFGLIAEEVEKVNPDLVVRDERKGNDYVRYEAVNAMLLNEFLKEHRTIQQQAGYIEEQGATIRQLKALIVEQEQLAAEQQRQIEGLTSSVRNVTTKIKLMNSSPLFVAETEQ